MRPPAQEAQTSGQVPSLPCVDGGAQLRADRLQREGGPHQPGLEPSGECPTPRSPKLPPLAPPGQTESRRGCRCQGAFIGELGRTGGCRAGGLSGQTTACPGPPRQRFPRHWSGPRRAPTPSGGRGPSPRCRAWHSGQAGGDRRSATWPKAQSAPLVGRGGFLLVDLRGEGPADRERGSGQQGSGVMLPPQACPPPERGRRGCPQGGRRPGLPQHRLPGPPGPTGPARSFPWAARAVMGSRAQLGGRAPRV